MRENCTYSLSGGRWLARKRATSDPTPEARRKHATEKSAVSSELGKPVAQESWQEIRKPVSKVGEEEQFLE
jgi:hypothetical protein